MKQPKFYFALLLTITTSQSMLSMEEDDSFVMITFSQKQNDTSKPSYTEQVLTASVLAAHDAQSKTEKADSAPQDKVSLSSLHSHSSTQSDESPYQKERRLTTTLRRPTPIPGGEKSLTNLPVSPRSFVKSTQPEKAADLRIRVKSQPQSQKSTILIPHVRPQLDVKSNPTPIKVAAFNIQSESDPRHSSTIDMEAQHKKNPLSNCDSLSYQNSEKSLALTSSSSDGENNQPNGLLDCFKSCWSSRKKKKA